MWYSEQGDLETARYIVETFDHAKAIYEQGQQYSLALTAGQAAITALAEQRAAAVGELYGLLDAIRHRSDAHPQLKAYAEEIRRDEREMLMEDKGFLEETELNGFTQMERQIRGTLHRYGLSQWQSGRLLEYLIGMFQMDTEQRTAFCAFLDTLS